MCGRLLLAAPAGAACNDHSTCLAGEGRGTRSAAGHRRPRHPGAAPANRNNAKSVFPALPTPPQLTFLATVRAGFLAGAAFLTAGFFLMTFWGGGRGGGGTGGRVTRRKLVEVSWRPSFSRDVFLATAAPPPRPPPPLHSPPTMPSACAYQRCMGGDGRGPPHRVVWARDEWAPASSVARRCRTERTLSPLGRRRARQHNRRLARRLRDPLCPGAPGGRRLGGRAGRGAQRQAPACELDVRALAFRPASRPACPLPTRRIPRSTKESGSPGRRQGRAPPMGEGRHCVAYKKAARLSMRARTPGEPDACPVRARSAQPLLSAPCRH